MKKILVLVVLSFFILNISAEELINETNSNEPKKIEIEYKEGTLKIIELKEVFRTFDGININYLFDNSKFIGEGINIEISISGRNDTLINQKVDAFSINRDGPIERNFFIEFPGEYTGNFTLAFKVESVNEILKETLYMNEPVTRSITGNVVLNDPTQKLYGYLIFIIIIGLAVFFIARNRLKEKDKEDLD